MKKISPKRVKKSNLATYRIGLLITRVYRTLNLHTTDILKDFDISPPEWAMLGILKENNQGLRSYFIAEELGVEASFVTFMHNKLIKKKLIRFVSDKKDKRVKLLSLTRKGEKFVESTEVKIRDATRPLVYGVRMRDMSTFFNVMKKIIHNAKNN